MSRPKVSSDMSEQDVPVGISGRVKMVRENRVTVTRDRVIFPFMLLALLLLLILPSGADAGSAGESNGEPESQIFTTEAALKAEMNEQWEEAARIYRGVLKNINRENKNLENKKQEKDPEQAGLWVRVADIEYRLGKKEEMTQALTEAARLKPGDKVIHVKLSRAHAICERPKEALAAIEVALKAEPDNTDYLEARAKLANWLGKPEIAAQSYRRLMKLLPKGMKQVWWLYLARSDSWSGRLERAAEAYEKYLSFEWRPGNLDVLVEFINVQTWRGDFASALKWLEEYKKKGGDENTYKRTRVGILCRAPRARSGLKELKPLLAEAPDDYELQTARTIALFYDHQPVKATAGLDTLQRIRPQSLENKYMRNFVGTPLRHAFPVGAQYYGDTIDIEIFSYHFDGGLQLNPRARIKGGYTHDWLRAPIGGGFNNIDGTEDAVRIKHWVGGHFQLSRVFELDGFLGTEKAEELPSHFTYGFDLDMRFSETFRLRLHQDDQYFLISPRAVSLDITKVSSQVSLQWEPGLRYTLELMGGYASFSDNNTRWQVLLAPRYASTRTSRLNLDLGAKCWWFGFDRPGHGYWAPRFFQSYMGAAWGYWKLGEKHALQFQGEAGFLKADYMKGFRFGYSVDGEALIGIFGDLMLKLRAGYLHNSYRINGGAHGIFSAWLFSASLTIRI